MQNDTASNGNNGGYDWATGPGGAGVFDANGNQTLVDPQLLRSEFVADYTRPDTSYFATSAKDIDDVSTWQCGSVNNPTAKDEILNAYAALWRPTSGADAGHIILTAAAERLSNNGNAFMGFWLFQGRVACNSATGTATPFVGAHNVGDVLILSNFTGGGNNPLVQVYVWNPSTAQATNPLELKFTGNFCSASDPLDQACGEVNTTSFQTPWAPSTTALTALDNNDFLEVGVDLTQLLTNANTTVPCFARFQAETRTSQETTAQLKDFASGSLNTCTATTVTHPKDANGATLSDSTPVPSSTVIHDEATVTGTALVGTAPNPKGTVAFSYCRTTDQTAGGSTACDASGSTSAGTATLDGTSNPATVSSSTVTGLSAGRYCFTAIYLDTGTPPDYALPASDDSTTECFLIAKASPTVTTQASANIVLGAGSLTDTATLAGGVSPTGSITFNLYGPNDATCAGTVVFTSTVSVSGNGNYTSAAFTPTAAGTYRWIANYSGDANNNATANLCNAANESVVVAPASPTVTTQASANIVLGAGSLTDTATLAGGVSPTGSITFNLYGPNNATCSGTALFTSTVSVSGNGNYTSAAFTPTAPGTYRWIANYSGDANNNATANLCNAANESVVVAPASPTVTTQASANIVLGAGSLTDTATLAGGVSPTGSITFNLYGPNNATCSGTALFTSTVSVSGNGNYTSAAFTPTAPGTYRWIANYSGDANNNATANLCNAANESVVVAPASPTVTTQASANIVLGAGSLTDTATLAGGVSPTGSITFNLYGPNDATCAGTVVFTSTVSVSGNGNYTSAAFTPTAAGTYRWIANYSGDANNNATANLCNAANESVVVAPASPTVTTQASANIVLGAGSLTDTATLAGGVSPTGSITFNLYGPNDATCAGTVVFTSTVSVSGNGNYTSAAFTPTAAGTYRWIANYSGDANNNATANGCNAANENVTVIHPSINIEKTPDSQSFQTGGTATFTITVTNTGDVTLTGVHITDAQAPGCARTAADLGAANATLDPGETFNYSCTKANVTADFTNSATATGTPPIGPDVTDTDTADVDVIAPAINIEKTPDSQSFQTGGTATFTITVTNTGDVTLTGVHITDAQAPGCARSAADLGADATLAPGASFNYQCTLANVTADFTNSATATGTPPTGPDVTDTDTAVVDVIHPSINIEKTPDSQRFLTHGTATFTITVTNTGDVTLTGVHVTDAEAAGCARTAAELGANATLVAGASFSYDCTRANVTADFTNSATVTGTPPVGPDVTDTDTADVDVIAPEITIEKTPDTQSLLTGSTATFTITVTNTGDVTLTDVHVTDAQAPGCARSAADLGAANATLDPGESFNYTCTLANVTADFTNSATVTGTPPLGQDVSSTDTAEVTVHQAPGINVEKTPDSQTILSGGTAAFTITVTNTGDVTLTGVHVTDAQAPGCARTAADLGANATLAPSASFNYQCTLANVTADFTNSATATGTPPAGPDVSDTDTAVVDVIHPAINVEKTPDSQSFQTGGTATFTITVTNTGDVALTGVHVTDAQAPGCARTAADLGANATLAPNASFNYQCTLANVTAGFTNSATVTGTPPVGPDVSDTDTADVTVTQAPPPPPPPPVPDARISINPPTAQNPVNTNHVLTAHVDVQTNTGQPFANAPDGTQITVSIASGPGSFTTANPCTTAGGTGSCTVTLTSAVAGTSVVNATATVTVSGVPLTRTTNGQAGNSGPAEKTWNILTPPPACESLSATPRQLKVGKAFTIVATAMLDNGKPMAGARVALTAPGKVAMTKRTNAQGVAKFNLKLQKKGILRLRVLGSPQCTARRGIAPPDEITG